MKDFHISREAYGALYGLPAIPNIFASLLGGALVDTMESGKEGCHCFPAWAMPSCPRAILMPSKLSLVYYL